MQIFSVGHSTRSAEDLLALLREAGVEALADVRRFPVSRRHPQHGRLRLEPSLRAAGIAYHFMGEALGGRLEPSVARERSENRAWREDAFRAYADALTSPAFERGLGELEARAHSAPTALLCAEADWRQCHRRILADVLVARGWEVVHLLRPGERERHELDPRARVAGGGISYPSLL